MGTQQIKNNEKLTGHKDKTIRNTIGKILFEKIYSKANEPRLWLISQ